MIDISSKVKTIRSATARGVLKLADSTVQLIKKGEVPKGDPIAAARVAAVQGAKNTPLIIPFCHPIPLEYTGVEFNIGDIEIAVTCTVKAVYKTGVEMEALTAVSIAILTLYDMLKPLDNSLEIAGIKLIGKSGGKSDFQDLFQKPLKGGVLVMSDSISAGKKSDESGLKIKKHLEGERIEVVDYTIIPDEKSEIEKMLKKYADEMNLDLVITTGGTGFSPRDCAPEAMKNVIERSIPGIPEAMRAYGQERTPYSMLSRSTAGIRGNTIIINLPGSRRGVTESLDLLFPAVLHSFKMLWGGGHKK